MAKTEKHNRVAAVIQPDEHERCGVLVYTFLKNGVAVEVAPERYESFAAYAKWDGNTERGVGKTPLAALESLVDKLRSQ